MLFISLILTLEDQTVLNPELPPSGNKNFPFPCSYTSRDCQVAEDAIV